MIKDMLCYSEKNSKNIKKFLKIYMNMGNETNNLPAAARYCICKDTLINTDKGLIAIQDLVLILLLNQFSKIIMQQNGLIRENKILFLLQQI